MAAAWGRTTPGLLQLPSGRLVRGRGLRRTLSPGQSPDFGLYLLGRRPKDFPWETRWLRWPDFWLPLDREGAVQALRETWERAQTQRVEIACGAGVGRTGTALACLGVIDGLSGLDAVAFVREHYDPAAVETARQHSFVQNFPSARLRAMDD